MEKLIPDNKFRTKISLVWLSNFGYIFSKLQICISEFCTDFISQEITMA